MHSELIHAHVIPILDTPQTASAAGTDIGEFAELNKEWEGDGNTVQQCS